MFVVKNYSSFRYLSKYSVISLFADIPKLNIRLHIYQSVYTYLAFRLVDSLDSFLFTIYSKQILQFIFLLITHLYFPAYYFETMMEMCDESEYFSYATI